MILPLRVGDSFVWRPDLRMPHERPNDENAGERFVIDRVESNESFHAGCGFFSWWCTGTFFKTCRTEWIQPRSHLPEIPE